PPEAQFPKPLDPVDDLPPITVITQTARQSDGGWHVRGTTTDNGTVKRVVVNGCEARSLRDNFAEWEVVVPMAAANTELRASAEDAAGNKETRPQIVALATQDQPRALAAPLTGK